MSNTPILHVLVPDLLQPLELWHKDFGFDAVSPELNRLLKQHQKNNLPFKGLDRTLFSLLGFPFDAELPVAYYRAKKEPVNALLSQHNGTLLCADPIHLEVGVSEVILNTHRFDDLSTTDADNLIALLNQHFSQDGLQFVKGVANRWYLLLAQDDSLQTIPLEERRGKNIAQYLPQSNKIKLQRVQNELQMLLHSSAVNQQREQQGKLPVNSLWFWGGGVKIKARTRVRSVMGGGIQGEVAALIAQCDYQATAKSPQHTLNQYVAGGHHLLILDQLTGFALQDDLVAWQQELKQLEQKWFAPMKKLLDKGKLKLVLHPCNGASLVPKKSTYTQQLWEALRGDRSTLRKIVRGIKQ